MEISFEKNASFVPENPIMVRGRLTKDIYPIVWAPREIIQKKVVHRVKWVTAGEARYREFNINPTIPDDQEVKIEWEEEEDVRISTTAPKIKLRAHVKRMPEGNLYIPRIQCQTRDHRFELFEAAKSPLTFLPQTLQQLVVETIKIRKHAPQTIVFPLAIVFLGISGDRFLEAYPRQVFKVVSRRGSNFTVVDGNDNIGIIHVPPEIEEKSLKRQFILFVPSNVELSNV